MPPSLLIPREEGKERARSEQGMVWRSGKGSGCRSLAGIAEKPPDAIFFDQVVHLAKPTVERDPVARSLLSPI